ncbi:MAG: hypothetical protein OHK0019_14560 [Saprospiraceae bacterium]
MSVAQNINTFGKGLHGRGYPFTISQDKEGRVYVGGYVRGINGIETKSLALLENGVWKKLPGDPESIWKTKTVGNDLYAVGNYPTINGGVLRWDGSQWDTLSEGLVSGSSVLALEWAADQLWLALGNSTLLRWENNAWQSAPLPTDISPFGLKTLGDTLFAWGNTTVSGYYDDAIAFYVNGTWTNLPTINEYGDIGDVERWGQDIFVTKGRKVFKWNGNSWDEFYTSNAANRIPFIVGTQNNLFAISNISRSYQFEKLDASGTATLVGTIEYSNYGVRDVKAINGDLWVGGDFSFIDDTFMGGLARFNGTEWMSPGHLTGDIGSSYGFCLYHDTLSGDLYVGGEFDYAGEVVANGVARWDGAQWHPMGKGFNNRVRKIFRYQGQLYAAGSFSKSGGQSCKYLARWTGSTWQEVLPTLDHIVRDAIEWNGKLYIAGEFNLPFSGLMSFDGSNWAAAGGTQSFYSLSLHEGNLIAGGRYNVVELSTSGSISSIGGFSATVLDLTEHNGDLYAAVNEGPNKGIYKYEGNGQWTNLNLPMDSYSNHTPWRVFSLHGNLLAMIDSKGMWRYANGVWEFLEGWRITDILPSGNDSYFFAAFPGNIYQHGEIYKQVNGVGELVFEKPSVEIAHTGDNAVCPRRHIFWEPVTEGVFMKYRWSFPGANIDSSSKRLAINYYPESGTYPVTLIAENLAGADTIMLPPIVVQDDCFVPPGPKPDNVWLLGDLFQDEDRFSPALDFYYEKPDSAGFYTPIHISNTNASICDDDGNLLFYTNGLDVLNHRHEAIAGSENFNKEGIYASYDYGALYDNQGALILPYPEHPSQYYLFHMAASEFAITTDTGAKMYQQPLRLAYSIVDINANNGLGQMTVKAQTAVNDTLLQGTLQAVRHGNGRDWWVVVHEFNSTRFYVLLLSPDGITAADAQSAGFFIFNSNNGQTTFSPDGSWLGMTDNLSDTAYLWRFDRCVGLFLPETILSFGPGQAWNGIGTGCSFSPSSRYFYASDYSNLYQFDLEAGNIGDSKELAGKWDGLGTPYSGVSFNRHLNAPDGKIYMSLYDGQNQNLNAINEPDEPGTACQFQNRAISLPARSSTSMPNYPNLRLGAVTDFPCSKRAANISNAFWKISPNPGNGVFSIKCEPPLQSNEAFLVEMYSLSGQLVRSENRRFLWEQTFDFQDVSPGVYLLRISGNQEYQTVKLIITP